MLDPRRLAVLREFAAQGTIARAADALSFTPSAVSQQLSQLQRESGVALFRRTGRRLELTDAGRMLAARAGELLARLEEVEAELARAAGDVGGTVRVAAFQTAARALVLPAIDRLAGTHPGLRMELVELEAEESLPLAARGGVELAIAEEYEHAPRPHVAGLERVHLDPDEMVLALPAAHPAAAGDPVPLAAVSDLAWATGHAGTAFSDMVTRICRAVGGFEPDVRYRVSDMDLLLGFVGGGRTAALVPMLGRPEREPGVAVRRIAGSSFRRALFVATRASDRARPATAAAVAAIGEVARTLHGPRTAPGQS
jgi:DNA-binding transcriptional LysR family regulator